MKFTVRRSDLARALEWASRALPGKTMLPVLNGLLFELTDNELRLSAFDLDMSAKATVPVITSSGLGRFLVSGKLISAFMAKAPKAAEEVEVIVEDGTASLRYDRVRLDTPLMPVEQYPALPPFDALTLVGTMDGGEFATAVTQTAFATSKTGSLAALTAVHVTFGPDQVVFVGTDRYRLAMRESAFASQHGLETVALVPPRVLEDAARIAPGHSVELYLSERQETDGVAYHSQIGIRIGGYSATSTLLGEKPIRYSGFRLPTDGRSVAEVDVADLKSSIERSKLVLGPADAVAVMIDAEGIEVIANGDSRLVEPVAARVDGEPVMFKCNPQFLAEGLDAVKEEVARLTLQDGKRPILLTPRRESGEVPFRYVLMPISS